MSELNEFREPESLSDAIKNGYDSIFGKQWPIWVGGILFGMINVFMFAFERPWSSANGIRNWGNWFFNSLEVTDITLISPHLFSTSILNFGIIAGPAKDKALVALKNPPILQPKDRAEPIPINAPPSKPFISSLVGAMRS